MSQEDTKRKLQSLGEFLCEQRQQTGASLADVSEATRISLPVLMAMEDDAHERMPAEAFCRGFYTIYANYLGLVPREILDRYQGQLEPKQKKDPHLSSPPVKKSKNAANYAEPSAVSPGTSMTFLLLTVLAIFAAICWYLKWNPADFISSKLMPSPPVIEQEQPEDIQQASSATALEEQPTGVLQEEISAATLPPTAPEKQEEPVPALAASPYQLEIDFLSDTTLKITLDDGFVLEKHFNAGETQLWEAENKIVLDMPESSKEILRLNGIAIPLPEAHNGRRRLSLPEDLLDTN